MRDALLRAMRRGALVLAAAGVLQPASAEPSHGIAMYGSPALPHDFVSLPYANPDAPKGGQIALGIAGSFDSLNPFVLNGVAAAGVSVHTVETLMGRSLDEPFSLYGLLAESVDTDDARSYVTFTLRKGARFSDGSPVTTEDVLWSFETLGTVGDPRYHRAWSKVASAEAVDDRTVRFTFNTADRELPLILGLRPILKKAQYAGQDFAAATQAPPIGSGPYVVETVDLGRAITYRRNPDWWGAGLPFNRGLHNLDRVKYEYFGAGTVLFEAFKGGTISSFRETNAARWQKNYDFPAVTLGEIVKSEIPHQRPSGIEGFVMNTRLAMFADWRVREALILAFNFEQINTTLNGGQQPRIASYFGNSALGMQPGTPATGRVAELLHPFAAELLPGAIEGYSLPVSDGSEANRANLRKATGLLTEAGWVIQDGRLVDAAGMPFAFEILLVQGADETASVAAIYVEALKRLGIAASVTVVDSAQYEERTTAYDFQMTHYIRALSLSPGNEQLLYWGAAGVTNPGSRNWMGMSSPAAEAMIATMLGTTDAADYAAATQALDRILTTGRYVIPIWYSDVARLAHRSDLKFPARLPIYGDWPGFQPEVWWQEG